MDKKKTRAGLYADRAGPLTQDVLKSAFRYDQETGLFIRKVTWRKYLAGSVAGNLHPNGYIYIGVNGTKRMAHRLAWLYMTGQWPELDIDHINGDKSDNRWANIREASKSINLQNQHRAHSNNKSGLLGVKKNSKNSWISRIRVKGRVINLGSFDDPARAYEAYLDAKRKYHPGWREKPGV